MQPGFQAHGNHIDALVLYCHMSYAHLFQLVSGVTDLKVGASW